LTGFEHGGGIPYCLNKETQTNVCFHGIRGRRRGRKTFSNILFVVLWREERASIIMKKVKKKEKTNERNLKRIGGGGLGRRRRNVDKTLDE